MTEPSGIHVTGGQSLEIQLTRRVRDVVQSVREGDHEGAQDALQSILSEARALDRNPDTNPRIRPLLSNLEQARVAISSAGEQYYSSVLPQLLEMTGATASPASPFGAPAAASAPPQFPSASGFAVPQALGGAPANPFDPDPRAPTPWGQLSSPPMAGGLGFSGLSGSVNVEQHECLRVLEAQFPNHRHLTMLVQEYLQGDQTLTHGDLTERIFQVGRYQTYENPNPLQQLSHSYRLANDLSVLREMMITAETHLNLLDTRDIVRRIESDQANAIGNLSSGLQKVPGDQMARSIAFLQVHHYSYGSLNPEMITRSTANLLLGLGPQEQGLDSSYALQTCASIYLGAAHSRLPGVSEGAMMNFLDSLSTVLGNQRGTFPASMVAWAIRNAQEEISRRPPPHPLGLKDVIGAMTTTSTGLVAGTMLGGGPYIGVLWGAALGLSFFGVRDIYRRAKSAISNR